ncbi:MAG: alpha/beta hydrolase [Nitrososphaera sp.]|jgi:3-oxoadipate enol-lactonase
MSPPPYFSADSIDTYYEDHGDVNSYPLVLIHPIGGNILIWNKEIGLLLESGYRVIAYEIRGHNRTGMGRVGAFAMQDLVNDLRLLLEHLKIKKCTIIGHSIGGIIASMYATQYPDTVDAIILINSSPKKFQERDLEKHFRTREIAIRKGIEALAEHKLSSFEESRDLFKDKKHSDFFRQVFTKTSVEGFVAATLALYTIPGNVVERLRSSNCKVFAIVGREDDTFMRLLKETSEEMPNLEVKVLEGSDHWVVIEKPDQLYDILIDFLSRINR